MNPNKEQLITAIEAHRKGECHKCPYEHILNCVDVLCGDTVKFINELTEENERLRANEKSATEILNFKFAYDAGKADAVRKMHSMLCEGRVSNDTVVIVADQVAKEMLEGVYEQK